MKGIELIGTQNRAGKGTDEGIQGSNENSARASRGLDNGLRGVPMGLTNCLISDTNSYFIERY